MLIHSNHSPEDYLSELKQQLGSSFDFGNERFTGFIIGRFFCITHHCVHEWNRRITGEKNTAIGIVKPKETGCKVRFFTAPGELRPQGLLMLILVGIFAAFLAMADTSSHLSVDKSELSMIACFIFVAALLAAIASAIATMLTDNGQAGYRSLISLLLDPANPYDNL